MFPSGNCGVIGNKVRHSQCIPIKLRDKGRDAFVNPGVVDCCARA
jgi:hypothetical protein